MCTEKILLSYSIFLDFYVFREREREGEREGEKHQCAIASHVPPVGDLAHNPGMYPEWVLNQQLFDSQARAQSTELHQPDEILFSIAAICC